MPTKHYVKNVSAAMMSLNLCSRGQTGKPLSLILGAREVSRGLSPSEFNSVEIQKALKTKDLVDVTARMAK